VGKTPAVAAGKYAFATRRGRSTVIEYCLRNADGAARERLRSRDDTRERACLDRCGRCYEAPLLVVDGSVVIGESHRALLDAVAEP